MGMGYQGYVKFTDPDPSVVTLTTGASINLVLEPIYSSAVWGAGWYNAATSAHYADNAIRYEGSVDFELQATSSLWNLMEEWFVSKRAYPKSVVISPDGSVEYSYSADHQNFKGAYNTSASFSTSEGSFVTVSAGVVALDRDESVPTDGGTYICNKTGVIASNCTGLIGNTDPLNPDGKNISPIPYWKTDAQLYTTNTYTGPFAEGTLPQSGLETVEWSVDLTQNQVILYTCNGSRLPTALLQGPIDVSGSVVLFHPDGVFDPVLGPGGTGSLTSPYMYAENTFFLIEIQTGASSKVYLEIPAAVVEGDDYSISDQSSVVNRSFDINGLGGRCNGTTTLPPLVMSDASGLFVSP